MAPQLQAFGPVPKLRMEWALWESREPGPFFSVCATFFGGRKNLNLENAKIKKNTQWIDQKCMLFNACVFTTVLLA